MIPGFLGTRADFLLDFVVVAMALIIPILLFSFLQVRKGHYQRHKTIQLLLASVLAVTLVFFEIDLQLSGGVFEMTRGSAFYGTQLLSSIVYIHLFFSISTTLLWIGMTYTALRYIPRPPMPNTFSRHHRLWGRLAMLDMLMTGITGILLYIVGFAY